MSIQRFPAVNNSSSSETLFKGSWNADTNTPALANTDNVTAGTNYYVSDAGTVNLGAGNITFEVGDIVINNGTLWSRIDATDAVASVAGKSGIVTLDADDISEGTTNKVFTNTLMTKLTGIEDGATADQTDTEIETAYNNRVAIATQAEAEAGTSTSVKRFTPERIKQAIAALGGGGTVQDATTKAIKVKTEVGTTGNARGTEAVDLQVYRSSADQVGSGNYTFQVGRQNKATQQYGSAIGYRNTSTGLYSIAYGNSNTSSADYSVALGSNNTSSQAGAFTAGELCTASGYYSTALGNRASAYLWGQLAHQGNYISVVGDSQYSRLTSREQTTDATATEMSLAHENYLERIVVPSGKSWRFTIEIVGKNTSNGDTFAATYVGAIKRVGSTTSLIGSVTERDKVNDAGASTWAVAVTADDTNEALKIEVTGEAAKTINWCAVVHLTEVA